MALDPKTQAVLDQMLASGTSNWDAMTPAQVRQAFRGPGSDVAPEVFKVEDRGIPGPAGNIPVRVYTPREGGPFPALMFFHGGGMVLGGLDGGPDVASRHLCLGADCVVISVDYRLAPENKFPAAAEDSYAATAWVAKNGTSINADGTRLAVTGVSAGGNLSAAIALMARDRGGPALALQVPVVPMIDVDYTTESYRERGRGDYYFTTELLAWCWNHYLNDESDAKNPYAAPLQAKDFRGVAPALVISAEYDPLCSEGEIYARRLKADGVSATYACYDTIHGFFGMPDKIDQGKVALAQASAALRVAFGN